jgi:zinc D-Ala-D-Ala dipeptidase
MDYAKEPINLTYKIKDKEQILNFLKSEELVILSETDNIKCANIYYQKKLQGTRKDIYILPSVKNRIQNIANIMKEKYKSGIHVFDAYRSQTTQKSIFKMICNEIRDKNKTASEVEIINKAKKFAANPDEPSHYPVSPHTTGAVIDLTFFYLNTGNLWNMGTYFDDTTEKSYIDYYEKNSLYGSEDIKNNRRILFNLMKDHDFVNYTNEWWHYGIGDCIWSQNVGLDEYLPEKNI